MWSSRLFWKLFFTYVVLTVVATLSLGIVVSRLQRDQIVTMLEQQLEDTCVLLRDGVVGQLVEGKNEQMQERVRRVGATIDQRLTLISMDGVVLADSMRESLAEVAEMDNHKDRIELIQAATLGEGKSERVSPTIGEPMLYFAVRADLNGEPVGLVRSAMSMRIVNERIASMKTLIFSVGAIICIAVVLLSYFVARRLVLPIITLTQAAEGIASGDFGNHVYFNANDELGELATSFNRMSEQLESREAQLKEGSQRLATVLEGMAEGVISLDDRQRIVLSNQSSGRLLGFDPAESQGKPFVEVVRNHKLHTALVESQVAKESRRVEIVLTEGDNRTLSIYTTLIPGAEQGTRFILVIQDITEVRQLETMRQEFVANVSHELKTPLSSIKAYAETLSGGAINDAENNLRFVHRIEDQAERLHQLILDLLSLARIESGQQAFEIGVVDVETVVLSCLAEHQGNAESKGVTVRANGDCPDLQIRADEEGTRQILNNLVNNAVNYTQSGGTVTVGWMIESSPLLPTMAVLKVSDTGVGIAEKHLPRLFERFYRVDKARSRELGGTGLGLSIVKHLTQSFGGSIDVQSEVGRGTTFTVKLPVA